MNATSSPPRRPREHLAQLASRAVSVLAIRVGGSLLSFCFSFIAVRLLGLEGAGFYFLAFSVMMFASVVARIGLDGTILRFVAHHASLEEWALVQAAARSALRIAGGTTVITGGLIFIAAGPIAIYGFNEPGAVEPLRVMGIAVITLSQMRLLGQALKGLNRQATAETVASVVQPLSGIILLYPLVVWAGPQGLGATGAAIAFLISSSLAALVGHFAWQRCRRGWPAAEKSFDILKLRSSAMPLWFSSTVNQAVLPWAPISMLGIWSTAAEAGIFGAAARVSNLIAVFLVGVNSVLAPQFSRMNAIGNQAEIGPLARQFSLLVTIAALPVFLLLIFAGNWVMGLFGPEFRVGGPVLAVLATGQFVSALCGSVRMVLIMTGNERSLSVAAALSLMTLAGLGIILIPHYGALGAAISSAAGTIVTNVFPVILVRRKMGIMIVPGLHFIWRDRSPVKRKET